MIHVIGVCCIGAVIYGSYSLLELVSKKKGKNNER